MVKIEDIAITFVPNLTPRAVAHLIERFGCAEGIYSASVENLMHRGELNESIAQQIVSGTGLREAERELNICGRCGVDILTSADGGYPEQLRFISDFPHLLYMVGDGSLLSCPTMCAVMGGQNGVSSYGEKMSLLDLFMVRSGSNLSTRSTIFHDITKHIFTSSHITFNRGFDR